ncbi:hypothetical protein CEXT_262541 [Caerostris extrusa]|uniref:Uncharacterized protein n=1 Tax=Caerostris extrusa TaxID=172846 RepID=A0AAV4R130_CAEEX|nr:hypothetical protein CEXT_262541 [Caerostris extrusa]
MHTVASSFFLGEREREREENGRTGRERKKNREQNSLLMMMDCLVDWHLYLGPHPLSICWVATLRKVSPRLSGLRRQTS